MLPGSLVWAAGRGAAGWLGHPRLSQSPLLGKRLICVHTSEWLSHWKSGAQTEDCIVEPRKEGGQTSWQTPRSVPSAPCAEGARGRRCIYFLRPQ